MSQGDRMYEHRLPVLMACAVAVSAAGWWSRAAAGEGESAALPGEVIAEVRERNPDLAALKSGVEAAGHAAPQAGAFPDPLLTVGLVNQPLASGSTPMTGLQVDLRQRLPWLGKLGALEEAALKDQAMKDALLEETGNALVARARTLLWELSYLEERRRLALEIGDTLDDFAEIARSAYAVGRGRQQDLIKPVIERQRIHDLVVGIDRQYEIVLSELNGLRDREPNAPVVPPGLPARPGRLPGLDRAALLEYARAHNPLLRLREKALDRQKELLRAAELEYVPDFIVGLQYRARWAGSNIDPVAGADFIGVTLGITLPVYASVKQDERVLEVRAGAARAEHERRGAFRQVEDRIERLVQAIERDVEQAALYRDGIIPDTEKALDSSLADYRTGRIEFLSVLDNLMSLFEARVHLARRTTRINANMAELERWLGGPLDDVLSDEGKTR